VADDHAEPRQRFSHFVELVQDVADRLRPVPVSGFAAVSEADPSNAVNTERADLLGINIVHKETEKLVVFV